jgi:ATP-binding cassette subfamily B protein
LGHAIGGDLGAAAYRRTLYQPYAVHVDRNSAEVVAALMNKVNTIVYFVFIPLLTLITSLLIVLSVVAFMLFIDPQLTAATFVGFGIVYAAVAYLAKRRLAHDGERVTTEQGRVTRVVQEGLGGIRDVLIYGLQETYVRIYRQADYALRRALARIAIVGGAPRPVIEAFSLILIAWLAYVLSRRTGSVTEAVPVLGALALAAQRLLPLVQQAYAAWTSLIGGQASLVDVLVLLEQPLPVHTADPASPIPFGREIRLRDVHFRYGTQAPWVLRGIDLTIPRGSRVGFTGTTGSGKTTLLDIVMGLLAPTNGVLEIDGVAIDEGNRRSWQAHIAHVPQAIFLADTTIAENIAFGVPREEVTQERIRGAARQARIAETIDAWRDGYDTVVGERGMRLSGGQRQRIGIARALYKQADVIVFDEATSALDDDTERSVMEAIDSLGQGISILIVAHRTSTLRNCDQIVELRNGVIHRVGTYATMFGQPVRNRAES